MPINFLLLSHPEIDNMDSRFRGNDDLLMDCYETVLVFFRRKSIRMN